VTLEQLAEKVAELVTEDGGMDVNEWLKYGQSLTDETPEQLASQYDVEHRTWRNDEN